MDAKSRARFINSVAGGQGTPCPNCNRLNAPDAKFCVACGTMLTTQEEPEQNDNVQDTIFCPSCGTSNQAGAVFCFACGYRIDASDEAAMEQPEEEVIASDDGIEEEAAEPVSAPAFKKIIEEQPVVKQAVKQQAVVKKAVARRIINFAVPEEDTEEASVFAKGLPAWDMVPPQVVVRRKSRS